MDILDKKTAVVQDTDAGCNNTCNMMTGIGRLDIDSTTYHRPDEAFVFGWFACEAVANETHFGHHAFPAFPTSFASSQHPEHLGLALGTHLGKWNIPLTL